MKNRILWLLPFVVFLCLLFAAVIPASGESAGCGEALTWELSNGVLTVSGEGPMDDFCFDIGENYHPAPWSPEYYGISSIVIQPGVTSVGNNAFCMCSNVESLSLPDTVTRIGTGAFSSCYQVPSVTIPENLSSLGENAFPGSYGFVCYAVPGSEGSKTISKAGYSFRISGNPYDCIYLFEEDRVTGLSLVRADQDITSASLPEEFTEIGESAFSGCEQLASLTLPSGIRKIGNYAFSQCTALQTLTIPSGVKQIGRSAFYGCKTTLYARIGSSGAKALSWAGWRFHVSGSAVELQYEFIPGVSWDQADYPETTGLAVYGTDQASGTVRLPSGVTRVACDAFRDNAQIKGVVLPDSVTLIDSCAFYGCSALKSINLPDGLTSVGSYAFGDCTSLRQLSIPENLEEVGYSAFSGCPAVRLAVIGSKGAKALSRAHCSFRAADLPFDLVYRFSMDQVSGLALIHTDPKTVTAEVPEGVTELGDGAFENCKKLEDVSFPSTLRKMEGYVFRSCKALKSIPIPDGLTEVAYNTFEGCSALRYAAIGSKGAKALGKQYFSFRQKDEPFDFMYSYSWDAQTFEYTLKGLSVCGTDKTVKKVSVPSGVAILGNHAFDGCGKLTSVRLPGSIRVIEYGAFDLCTSLKKLTLPDHIQEISYNAFPNEGITLYSVVGSDTAKALGRSGRSFRVQGEKYNLRYLFSEDQESGLQAEKADAGIVSAVLPAGVTHIGNGAFEDCKKLTSIRLPDTLTAIGGNAFYNCESLPSISLPKSVRDISRDAFAGTARSFFVKVAAGSAAERYVRSLGLPYDNGRHHVVGTDITDVNTKVNWIVSHYITPGMSEREKALVLHNWLIFNAHYDLTFSTYGASGVLIKGYGVCNSYALAYELLLTRAQLANRFLSGSADNGTGYAGHAWNLVRIDGHWYHVDTTWDDPVSSLGRVDVDLSPVISGAEGSSHFLLSDSEIGKDHRWDSSISADLGQVGHHYEPPATPTPEPTPTPVTSVVVKNGKYKLSGNTAVFTGPKSAGLSRLVIQDTVSANGKTYKVTKIAAKACKGMKKLTSVVIGQYVSEIGKDAFRACPKLKKITIRSSRLAEAKIGSGAFSGGYKKPTVYCPKNKLKLYLKILQKKGIPKKAVFLELKT